MEQEQYVCKICGYNMIGYMKEQCPFCSAAQMKLIPSEQCSMEYHVEEAQITDEVFRVQTVPELGYRHSAYRIDSDGKSFWIDCPSIFDKSLRSIDAIRFTHHHFMGSSNQYKNLFNCAIHIHEEDARHTLSRNFPLDVRFTGDYSEDSIDAFHVGGHTPGFTFYRFDDVIFVCDYVFFRDGNHGTRLNPFGSERDTRQGLRRILDTAEDRAVRLVCGYDYVTEFPVWKEKLEKLLSQKPSSG